MDEPQDDNWPASLNWLKRLVIALAGVMIAGFILLIAMLLRSLNAPTVALPDQVSLPQGMQAEGLTAGRGWYAVVTAPDDTGVQHIVIYDAATGAIRSQFAID